MGTSGEQFCLPKPLRISGFLDIFNGLNLREIRPFQRVPYKIQVQASFLPLSFSEFRIYDIITQDFLTKLKLFPQESRHKLSPIIKSRE